MPPDSTGPDQSPDLLGQVTGWLSDRFDEIIRVLSDPDSAAAVLSELGWEGDAPVLPAQLLTRLDPPPPSPDGSAQRAETLAELAVAFDALGEALLAAANTNASPVVVAELVADLFDIAMAADMKQTHPAVWALLRLLGLLDDDVFQLARVGDLVSNPGQYLAIPEGPAYARRYAAYSLLLAGVAGVIVYFLKPRPNDGNRDWLDPHGHDVNAFGIDVLYGWAPASPAQLDLSDPANPYPHLTEVLTRMLTLRVDLQGARKGMPGVHDKLDFTFALVPPEHMPAAGNDQAHPGGFGLYIRMSGLAELEFPLGRGWQLSLTSPGSPAAEALVVAGQGGAGFVRGTSGGGLKTVLALERPADVSGSAVFGSKDHSHLEIEHGRVAFTLDDDDKRGLLFDLSAHADHVIVDIELGRDSFLSKVLPPSLRIDTKLGLGVELGKDGRGLYLDGGVSLVVDLPVNLGVSTSNQQFRFIIQGLHLRVGPPPEDSGTGADAAFVVAFTADLLATIFGGTATVAGIGAEARLTQAQPGTAASAPRAGRWEPVLVGVPPKGIGLLFDIKGTVKGGGFISYDAAQQEYSGALQLNATIKGARVDFTGLGMLDTSIPGHPHDWALLVIVTAAGFSWEVGGGFAITGLGGVVGYNRTIDTDAIAAGLRTKSLDAILFPPDPVAQAPHIFSMWKQTMPVADGGWAAGIMARGTWGSETLSEIDLGILVSYDPRGFQVVFLASLRLHAPTKDHPLFRFRLDFVGRMTFDPFGFVLQAALVDSKIGHFPVSGGAVLAVGDGSEFGSLLSVGGFNPHFTPPPNLPPVDRFRIDLSQRPDLRIRIDGYAAITSQTVQLGGRVQLHAAAGPLAVDGWFSLDGLVHWKPKFGMSLEVAAGLTLSFEGSPLMELSLDVLFEGPGPWRVHGYVSLSLLFYTLSLPIEGGTDESSYVESSTVDPLQLVRDALSAPRAWSAPPSAASAAVTLRGDRPGGAVPAHPLGVVSCRQQAVPLGLQLTHVGNLPLAAPVAVDVTAITLAGAVAPDTAPVVEGFAAAQFLDLSDDDALSRPSFEPMRAGLATGGSRVDTGNATAVATTYKTVAVDGATRTQRPPWLLDVVHANAVLRPPPAPTARPAPIPVTVASDTLRTLAGASAPPQPASIAAQRAGSQRLLDLCGMAGGAS
jgi:hypothetical protein